MGSTEKENCQRCSSWEEYFTNKYEKFSIVDGESVNTPYLSDKLFRNGWGYCSVFHRDTRDVFGDCGGRFTKGTPGRKNILGTSVIMEKELQVSEPHKSFDEIVADYDPEDFDKIMEEFGTWVKTR